MFQLDIMTELMLFKDYGQERTQATYRLNGEPCSAMLQGVFWNTRQVKDYLKQLRAMCKQVKQVTN